MEEKRQGSNGSGVLGVMLGAFIGAAAAMLFAPKSGEETRRSLKKRADEMRDKMMDKAKQASDKAVEKTERARDKIKERAEQSRTASAEPI